MDSPKPLGASSEKNGSIFLLSRNWDITVLVLAPLLFLGLCIWLPHNPQLISRSYWGSPGWWWLFCAHALVDQCHFILVFFRSHGRVEQIRKDFFRRVVVPAVLFPALYFSNPALLIGSALVLFWGIYHHGAQTFGLCRIYDRNAGNSPAVGRRADFWISIAFIVGPTLTGWQLSDRLSPVTRMGDTDFTWLAFPASLAARFGTEIRAFAIVGTLAFLVGYLLHYRKLRQQGLRPSRMKGALLGASLLVAGLGWGFLPLSLAVFVVDFQHTLQYFYIVWISERKHIESVGRPWMPGSLGFSPVLLLIGIAALYGFAALQSQTANSGSRFLAALVIWVSLLHFWYDGFIWSVRKGQV